MTLSSPPLTRSVAPSIPQRGAKPDRRQAADKRPHPTPNQLSAPKIFGLLVIVSSLLWSYWGTIQSLLRDWRTDEDYSVGMLVPIAAAYVLWQRRASLQLVDWKPCWWGALVVIVAQAMRIYGLFVVVESIERYSLVVTIGGLLLLVGGAAMTWRMWTLILFLLLMIPLPGKLHNTIAGPLQNLATLGAVFSLELLGSVVVRDGHVITLNGTTPLAVAEACSGLRMMTAFVVVGCVISLIVERPLWQKLMVVVSTVPVAMVCNLVRLVVTAKLFEYVDGPTAERFFHDFAGWFMMPLAIAFMFAELWILKLLTTTDKQLAS